MREFPYSYVKAFSKRNHHHEWTDEVDKDFRHIYLRCFGCRKIYRIGNEKGTLSSPLRISEIGDVYPCCICPYCGVHIFPRLLGYQKTDVPDIFRRAKDEDG